MFKQINMKKIAVLLTIIIAFLGIFIFSCEEEKIEEVKNVTNKLAFKEIRVDSVSYSMSKVSWILENLNKNSIDDFGICYNTSGEPTLEDNTIKIPPYSSGNKSIEGLSPNTKYYFRLFAEIGDATVFSKEDNFSTNPLGTPTVTTAEVTYIDATSATSGGNITDNGGFEITACGVCWSTSQDPTVNDNHTTDGTGTGSFTSELTGLNEVTTYYVRAYATNSVGTAYGEERSFLATDLPTIDFNGTLYVYPQDNATDIEWGGYGTEITDGNGADS